MEFQADFGEFHLADNYDQLIAESWGSTPEGFVRTESFVSGMSSHTRVATPDPVEERQLRIAAPPSEPGPRVVTPPNISKWGDFRRTIQVSGENASSRELIGLKLNGSATMASLLRRN